MKFPQQRKPEVEIKDEVVRPQDSVQAEQANHLVRQAGDLMRAGGYRYIGSAVVHYYDSPLAPSEFMFVQQTPGLERVHEGMASAGWKTLRKAMQRVYGRKPTEA